MSICIVPHRQDLKASVNAFNQRMRQGGSPWGFYPDPIPDWLPYQHDAPSWREYHLVVEDGDVVRGGFALKPQKWSINGRELWVSDWQGPFSEGVINPRYASLGIRIVRDVLKKFPLVYTLGHGGDDPTIVKLLASMKWTLHQTPFCLAVLNPFRFLRKNRYLRRDWRMRLASDLAAFSGAASTSLPLVRSLRSAWSVRNKAGIKWDIVAAFGDWADELWRRHSVEYSALAVRDSEMMNRLLPASGWPGGTRLHVKYHGESVGWAVVHCKQMQEDPRFGDLRVGLITDAFGDPQHAAKIISSAHDFLAGEGCDLICSNQTHQGWLNGFRDNGYFVLPNRRLLTLSPELRERLEPFDRTMQRTHLTALDGHGPHGFV